MSNLSWLDKLNSSSSFGSPSQLPKELYTNANSNEQAQTVGESDPVQIPVVVASGDAPINASGSNSQSTDVPLAISNPAFPFPPFTADPKPLPNVVTDEADMLSDSHGTAELDMDAAYLSSMGADAGLTLGDVGVSNRIEAQIEFKVLPKSAQEHYADVVLQLMAINVELGRQMESLQLFESPYVGLITTPEMASDHIAQCHAHGVPVIGNTANTDVEPTTVAHKQYINRRYKGHRAKKNAVEGARLAWKKAVENRKQAMIDWDNYVKQLHLEFNRLSQIEPEFFIPQGASAETGNMSIVPGSN